MLKNLITFVYGDNMLKYLKDFIVWVKSFYFWGWVRVW